MKVYVGGGEHGALAYHQALDLLEDLGFEIVGVQDAKSSNMEVALGDAELVIFFYTWGTHAHLARIKKEADRVSIPVASVSHKKSKLTEQLKESGFIPLTPGDDEPSEDEPEALDPDSLVTVSCTDDECDFQPFSVKAVNAKHYLSSHCACGSKYKIYQGSCVPTNNEEPTMKAEKVKETPANAISQADADTESLIDALRNLVSSEDFALLVEVLNVQEVKIDLKAGEVSVVRVVVEEARASL